MRGFLALCTGCNLCEAGGTRVYMGSRNGEGWSPTTAGTRTRLTEATELAKDLEGVRLDSAAEARRVATALPGRPAADPA
jgi:hypothetical protein